MRRTMLSLPPLAFLLSACVAAETSVVYGTFEVAPGRGPGFCENYAQRTFENVYDDLYDPYDSFGARSFAHDRAERAADRAYQRCLSGRTN